MNIEQNDLARCSILKLSKILLTEDFQSYLRKGINFRNVLFLLKITKLFHLPDLFKELSSNVDRLFSIVAGTSSFLELDFALLSKILGSSQLNITSEVEVFEAACDWLNHDAPSRDWLNHDAPSRGKRAKHLLLKVRLPLLSQRALEHLLKKSSPISRDSECITILELEIKRKKGSSRNDSRVDCTSRYCDQNMFNFLICGGREKRPRKGSRIVKEVSGRNFNSFKFLPSMVTERCSALAVCSKGDVYVFGGFKQNNDLTEPVEKYSTATNAWEVVAEMSGDVKEFCGCAFADKIFIIGAVGGDSCSRFDTRDAKWARVAGTNEARESAACAVFEEKIVLCGGNRETLLHTAESYDVFLDEWVPMPDMNVGNFCHSLVAVKSKLFVIGTEACEVYDSTSRRFTLLQSYSEQVSGFNTAMAIGRKIYAFSFDRKYAVCYDTVTDVWTEKTYKKLPKLGLGFSSVKMPVCFDILPYSISKV